MTDEYDLERTTRAQSAIYDRAIAGLRHSRMQARYMALLFPRLNAASPLPASHHHAITCLDEARAYLATPILGGRYRECIGVLQRLPNTTGSTVFGNDGARKLHASLTLFSVANGNEFLLETLFDVWFDGLLHEETMLILNRRSSG
jgi:uncharacterized protein (DUF1810 family)